MAVELGVSDSGIKFIKGISLVDLMRISESSFPACDGCLKSLSSEDKITLIPLFNGAYCSECVSSQINKVLYKEDLPTQNMRVKYYLHELIRDF